MAKLDTAKKPEPKPDDFPVTLDEFCRRLSVKDKRVEMIGGFHFDEKLAKRVKDMESAYMKRFEAFTKRPA
ncbi:MAG: hypothetical protein ACU843_12840 [Gammaproteobacteria bacterium]